VFPGAVVVRSGSAIRSRSMRSPP